jgi:hypothetical protein
MNEEVIENVTECCIDGVVVTAELLSAYLRSWARHGVYFQTEHAIQSMAGVHIVYHDMMTYRFSHGHSDKTKRGKLNAEFLDPGVLAKEIFRLHAPIDLLNVIKVFPVSHIYPTEDLTLQKFLDRLAPFLSGLPSGYRYALGVQNSNYLLPAYFDCLREHSVAHVFCASRTMPGLLDQVRLPYALTADAAVVLTEPRLDVEWQLGMMEIIRRCVDAGMELYICFDPSAGCQTTSSLAVLMETMSGDLAKLSPLRATKAA